MEESINAILRADADVFALVGFKVFPGARFQATGAPALVYTRISGVPQYSMNGPNGLFRSRVQLDAYDRTYAGAKRTARAARNALSGIQGTYGDTFIEGVFFEDERDDPAPDGAGRVNTPERYFRVRLDFMIWHKEA